MANSPEHAASPADEGRRTLAAPEAVDSSALMWRYIVAFAVIHGLACLALVPWLFSWTGVIAAVVGTFFFGQGVNFCYHRLLTHRSFVIPRWLEYCWVVIALCCMEDTPCKWVTTHRMHHKHSDQPDDPHSPLVSFIWGHMQWITVRNASTHSRHAFEKYARDILSDPFYMKLERCWWLAPAIYGIHAVVLTAIGAAIGWFAGGSPDEAMRIALSMLVWGVILRTAIVWHITWSINSLTHIWGYRNFETGDHSRNNILLGFLASGEGWHNNHHSDQASACNQIRWWEADMTWWHIALMRSLGLATKVVPPRHVRERRRAQAAAATPGPSS